MAMGQGGRDRTKSNLDNIRTPDKPASSGKLRRAPATLGSLTVTSTPSSASSTASASRSRKRNSSAQSVQNQPTLTQIDFVTVPRDSDDEFDYVDESAGNPREVIEIEDDEKDKLEDDDDADADYQPLSTLRKKRPHGVQFDDRPSKQKKASKGDNETSKKAGRRKSGDRKGKGSQKVDKTLTQMNYIQRVVIDPDEDTKLEYAYITPRKKGSERETAKPSEAEDVQQESAATPELSSEHKRRKLSSFADDNQSPGMEDGQGKKRIRSLTTPQKSIRREIPSSQSPDSPGVAFITSSQFRGATHSPRKRSFHTYDKPTIKEESPDLHLSQSAHKLPERTASNDHKLSLQDAKSPHLLPAERKPENTSETPLKAKGSPKPATEGVSETPQLKQRNGPTQRTVVYETDAESDYDDFEDDLPDVPSSPQDNGVLHSDDRIFDEDAPDSQNPESQELPPFPSEQEVNSGPLPSDSHILSDASICYRRHHQATQFPLEPVPTINTQKMAELFPDESNDLQTLTSLSQPSSPLKTHLPHPPLEHPLLEDQTHEDNAESQAQGIDRTPTEVVPESSPVARQGDSASLHRRALAGRDVVQVESSQPVDRIKRHMTAGEDSVPRGILTRSQILTSSVMESIPIPAFWMGSQDSVGEPYILPDT